MWIYLVCLEFPKVVYVTLSLSKWLNKTVSNLELEKLSFVRYNFRQTVGCDYILSNLLPKKFQVLNLLRR